MIAGSEVLRGAISSRRTDCSVIGIISCSQARSVALNEAGGVAAPPEGAPEDGPGGAVGGEGPGRAGWLASRR